MVFASNEEPEHGDDLARRLAWWSSMAWTVDRPRAQGARPARAAVAGGGLGEPTPYNGCRIWHTKGPSDDSRGSVFSLPRSRGKHLLEGTGSVASEAGRSDHTMCYTRNDERDLEKEARRITESRLLEEEARRRQAAHAQRRVEEREKPLTEKVKEMVGVK